jgi:aspartate/methionine/tyrosine aminotransferase
MFEERSNEAMEILGSIKGVQAIKPQGAFYMTVVFEDGVLNKAQSLPATNSDIRDYMDELLQPSLAQDHRFVYHLMASKGICVVPLSSFCCDEMGFRFTLLESNSEKRREVFELMAEGIRQYLGSCGTD